MAEHPHVQLGSHSLPCYAQPHSRVTKGLGRVLDALRGAADEEGGVDMGAFVLGLGDRLYETLTTFIPNLPERIPQYEFAGYSSREAFDTGDYEPQTHDSQNRAPTFPEFLDAFDTIIEVNGGKRFLDMLGKVFDPAMLRAEMSLALSEWRERSTTLPSLPGPSGESHQNGSTTTPPTSDEPHGVTSPLEDGIPNMNPSGSHLAVSA